MTDNSTSSVDWQPIETAPRDGTRFLAFSDHLIRDGEPYLGIVEYDPASARHGLPWQDTEDAYHDSAFSHWAPLPKGPADV